MTTEGKTFKKLHHGPSGGKTGEANPRTHFDKKKGRWVLNVKDKDIEEAPKRRAVTKIHKEPDQPSKRKYKEREVSPETGKLVKKKKTEYAVKKHGKSNLKLIRKEPALHTKLKRKWEILRDRNGDLVYRMRGQNKITGSELEIIIKEPKRGKVHDKTVFANAFVVDKKTGKVISNINLEIDGRGRGLFENGFDGCVREMQFNPYYLKYLNKYMETDLAGKTPEQAAKAVCGAILESHGGPYIAEKQAVVMLQSLCEKKYFMKKKEK